MYFLPTCIDEDVFQLMKKRRVRKKGNLQYKLTKEEEKTKSGTKRSRVGAAQVNETHKYRKRTNIKIIQITFLGR